MASRTSLRVLFVAAAGPRIGFGHLVRCRSLARALGVAPLVTVRGTPATRRRAASLGWRLSAVRNAGDLLRLDPQLLVVDDPSARMARAWVERARRLGVPVATVHDLGIAAVESDLLVDGSVQPSRVREGRYGSLRGPAYAVLDPRVRLVRERGVRPAPRRVLIALGGGPHSTTAGRLARAIATRRGDVEIRIAGGFAARGHAALPNATWIDVRDGLVEELSSASVAVLAGGLTVYEACALGVPVVALALNAAQHITIRAVARRGAAVDAGSLGRATRKKAIVGAALAVDRLLQDATARRRVGTAGRQLVDGRGAARVAARLRQLTSVAAGRIRRVA